MKAHRAVNKDNHSENMITLLLSALLHSVLEQSLHIYQLYHIYPICDDTNLYHHCIQNCYWNYFVNRHYHYHRHLYRLIFYMYFKNP